MGKSKEGSFDKDCVKTAKDVQGEKNSARLVIGVMSPTSGVEGTFFQASNMSRSQAKKK